MRIWRIGAALAAWLAAAAAPGVTLAHDGFPNRPVHIVIPYSAGSVADVFGRIVAQNMAAQSDVALWAKVVKDASITAD